MKAGQEGNRDSNSQDPAGFSRLAEGDFHARLAAVSGVAAVLFSAPGCGACRAWKRLLPQALSGLADALFEVDVDEATGVARYYNIFHLPTIYLYRDGQFHAELQCEARHDSVRQSALRMLAGPAQDEP
jgi:thioredoxin 1